MRREKLFRYLDIAIFFSSLLLLISFLLIYGFCLSAAIKKNAYFISHTLIVLFIINKIWALLSSVDKIQELKAQKLPYIFTSILLLQFIFISADLYGYIFPYADNEIYYHAITLIFIVSLFLFQLSRANTAFLLRKRLKPEHMFVLSFLALIISGTFLLMMPAATVKGGSISLIDALFTSTSAVCVTGLTVQNTAVCFTVFGKTIIMALIQLGGLGIMTSTSFLTLLFLRKMSMSERFMLGGFFTDEALPDIPGIVKTIFFSTILIEFFGAVLLFVSWRHDFPSPQAAFFHSIFHSVSAFCNAGFSSFPDNLINYRCDLMINAVITSLIIIGGLGFFVIFNILVSMNPRIKKTLNTHSRIVLTVTASLIILGTLFIFIFEYNTSFCYLSFKEKFLASYFQSVTARTAGFNTVDIGALSHPVLLFISFLMYVGGSPGSTAGGIKTTTLGVLAACVMATVRKGDDVAIFKRRIENKTIYKALSLVVLSLMFIFIVSLFLIMIEKETPIKIFFETVSAFGTVGLSTGITSQLSAAGKLAIIMTMFVGRLGPVTLAVSLSRQDVPSTIRYPLDSNIMIG